MKIIKFFSSGLRRIPPPPIIIPSKHLSILPAPVKEEAASQASSLTAPAPPNKAGSKRRALLIGIQNKPPEERIIPRKKAKLKGKLAQKLNLHASAPNNELRGCHKDVREMKKILIELYGYQECDIVLLMDGDDNNVALPTEENIMQHMRLLVADAKAGDHFFLHFSGHSTQEPTDSIDEEDGMDEFIVTYDGKLIKDDILRSTLVDPLPIGSRLITVFDTCHSASLLDLKHSRCNRVYVPWINKGRRRSYTQWNRIVRKHAQAPMSPSPMSPITSENRFPVRVVRKLKRSDPQKSDTLVKSTSGSRKALGRRQHVHHSDGEPRTPLSIKSLKDKALPRPKIGSDFWLQEFVEGSPIQRCVSPEVMFCEGWCDPVENAHLKFADVISLSAAKDGERAWEDSQGSSMTRSLVAILRRNPHPTLEDLLMSVSHDLHHLYIGIHAKSRDYKKKARMANIARIAKGLLMKTPASVEMDNFQNPQISSLYPLDTKTKLWAP